jgi:hypothetical protein
MYKRMGLVMSMVMGLSLMLVGTTLAQNPADTKTTFTATLTGEAERSPAGGDPDGDGTATVTLNAATGEACWEIAVSGIDQPAAAHIHRGTAAVVGPVVVPFGRTFQARGCAMADAAVIREIMAAPADFYVNVHNPTYPEGAIRGQLTAPAAATLPDTGASSPSLHVAGLALVSVLAGLSLHTAVRRRPTI